MTLGCKDNGNRKSVFVTKTQLRYATLLVIVLNIKGLIHQGCKDIVNCKYFRFKDWENVKISDLKIGRT